ncbi:MAG: hypothetical protein ACYTG0_01340 [Planctomycetota bacterium]|jgi:hypothetical protein
MMMSPESGSQSSEPEPQSNATDRGPERPPTADPALVQSVLEQTLTMCSSDEPLDGESRRAVKAVVVRRRGKPFSLEPVAVELVAAVLRTQLAAQSGRADTWRTLSIQVAQTLCEDPASRKRLEAFWRRISGAY